MFQCGGYRGTFLETGYLFYFLGSECYNNLFSAVVRPDEKKSMTMLFHGEFSVNKHVAD